MKELVSRLIKGLEVKSRTSGNLHNVKAGTATVAEVCVGSKTVRVNFKARPKGKTSVKLEGESSKWAGGGVVVTEANVADVRKLIEAAVEAATPKPADPDKPEAPKSRLRRRSSAEAPNDKAEDKTTATGVQAFATA
jgi:hypothetical protein